MSSTLTAAPATHDPREDAIPVGHGPDATEAQHRAVRAFQAEEARRARRAARNSRWTTGVLGSIAALEAAAILAMMPLVRVEPVFVEHRADGTTMSVAWSSLPPDTREANIQSLLWQYVRLREGWSSGEAEYAWNVVSAMSAKPVRDQYQAWARPQNPEGPQKIYGTKATVRLDYIGASRLSEDTFLFRFHRVEAAEGREAAPVAYQVSLRYRPVEGLPAWQRVTFNPAGVQVWEYPGAVREGTRR